MLFTPTLQVKGVGGVDGDVNYVIYDDDVNQRCKQNFNK